ncbi:hypothetical protein L484_008887 [Morus notabilis]|uniref:Uncharacterized protein n=1 Tax=Morus notabilis TaxID=981085 RepID=W9QWS7_9ROSA|nr:hypothetical protein L484_008887 [Morus notabilis]
MKIILHCTDNEKSWKELWFLAISDETLSSSTSCGVTLLELEKVFSSDEASPEIAKNHDFF